jgi:hypothetical protein
MAFNELHGAGGSGIMMGADGGPMMSGTWVNPATGHKFTVRDCFFQDNNFMVQTTDGQVLDYNVIKDYVQTSDDGPEIGKQPQIPRRKQKQLKQLPSAVSEQLAADDSNYMIPEDQVMIQGSRPGLGNINDPHATNTVGGGGLNPGVIEEDPDSITSSSWTTKEDPDLAIIKRVLGNHPLPDMESAIVWADAPIKQFQTLVEVLGIRPEAIAQYYISQLNMNAIAKHIEDVMTQYIIESSKADSPSPAKEEIQNPKPPKRTTRKTKKKTE